MQFCRNTHASLSVSHRSFVIAMVFPECYSSTKQFSVSIYQNSTNFVIIQALVRHFQLWLTLPSLLEAFSLSFLWFKQRVFYIYPRLKKLNNKIVQSISNGVMVIWFLHYVTLYFCYFIPVYFHFNVQGGCSITESSYDAYFFLIVSRTATSILMQIILLGLFIYPILKGSLWLSNQNYERNNGLMKRVKKAILLASICLADDLSILAN